MTIKKRVYLSVILSFFLISLVLVLFLLFSFQQNEKIKQAETAGILVQDTIEWITLTNEFIYTRHTRSERQWYYQRDTIVEILENNKFPAFQALQEHVDLMNFYFIKLTEEFHQKEQISLGNEAEKELTDRIINMLIEKIRLGSQDMLSSGFEIVDQMDRSIRLTQSKSNITLISFILIFILFIIFYAIESIRKIIKPLNHLLNDVKNIDMVNFQYDTIISDNVRELHGTDELSELTKAFNEMARRLNDSFSNLVNEMKERERAEEQLSHSKKMDSLGQLAGGIAHDFNNLLTSIMSSAEMLSQSKEHLDEEELKFIDYIISASLRGADLTAKLLAYGRKGSKSLTEVDIHKVIDDTMGILKNTIDKRITISIEKRAEFHFVKGDNSELYNGIMNLCLNAIQAMAEGGKIEISTKNKSVSESYCHESVFDIEPGKYCEIKISDTGKGIPPENLSKIFEPFFTTKELGKGTGLGLSAVYGTIQAHHGEIQVHSELGMGTIFRILLPCIEVTAELWNHHS